MVWRIVSCCSVLFCTTWGGCKGWWNLNVTQNSCHFAFPLLQHHRVSKRSLKLFEGFPANFCFPRSGDSCQYCASLEQGQAKKVCNYSCAPASAAKGQIWLQYWCRNDTDIAFFHVRKSFPWRLMEQMQLEMLPIPGLVWHNIWPIFVNSFINYGPRFSEVVGIFTQIGWECFPWTLLIVCGVKMIWLWSGSDLETWSNEAFRQLAKAPFLLAHLSSSTWGAWG